MDEWRFSAAYFGKAWLLPMGMIVKLLVILAAASAVNGPFKHIRHIAVTETINELQ